LKKRSGTESLRSGGFAGKGWGRVVEEVEKELRRVWPEKAFDHSGFQGHTSPRSRLLSEDWLEEVTERNTGEMQ